MGTMRRRAAAAVAVICLFAAVLVTATVAPAGGDVFPSNCRGGNETTEILLGGFGAIPRTIPLSVGVTGTVPATVGPGDGGFPVEFNWSLELDGDNPDLAYLWDYARTDSITVEIVDLTLPVLVSGAGTTVTDVTGTPPDGSATFVKGEKTVITGGSVTADIPITGSGGDQIFFAVGEPTFGLLVDLRRLNNPIDLALACDVRRLFAATTISVDGAPTIDSIDEQVDRGGTLAVDVGALITEGDGPLIPGSLEITEPPAEGAASLSDTGTLTYDAPDEDGEVWIGLRVCGEPAAPTDPGDSLCGAGTLKIAIGTGISAPPGPTPPPTGTPTPGVQATDEEPSPSQPAPAPAAAPVTAEPSFTG